MCCRLLCRSVNSPLAGAISRQPQCAPPLEFANPRSKISNYPINQLSSVAAAGGCKAGSGLSISVAGNAMETPESSRTTGKKRARDEEADGDDEQGADETLAPESDLAFSDTLIALRMMHAQFPKVDKVAMKPFVLRSQLYSSVKDRTQVDRDLEALKKEKLLRLFKLNTGQDDHAIMFLNDYLEQMAIVLKRLEAKSQQNAEVFEWFKRHVIESNLDVSIKHQELCSLLSFGGEVNDKHVTLLINAGLLTRQLIDSNVYWFAIPNIGSLLKGLSQGRKELLSFMNRRKYKEMLLTPLEKKRLRLSPLDMRFHLRDLIGSGHLKTVQTPMGLLVQVSKD